jgi:hypothetical protein
VADIAVVPADVVFRIPEDRNESNQPYQAGLADEEITAGAAVYRKQDNTIALAMAHGTSLESKCIGISADHAYPGQVVAVCGPNGDVDLGVNLTVGQVLYLSPGTYGKICPFADVEAFSGSYYRPLGTVTETRNFRIDIEDLDDSVVSP